MLLIVDSHDGLNLRKFSCLSWIYIGSRQGLASATRILKQNKRRFIGKDIEYVVDFVRDNFVDYIGRLSQQQKDKVIWYSSRLQCLVKYITIRAVP